MEFKSVNLLLQESFQKNWDKPALSNHNGVTLKYSDVARRIAKIHIAFSQCDLHKGDKVAICSRNQANWGVSFMAAITYGAVPVPILHEFKPGSVHHLVNHSEARVLFVDEVVWEGLNIEEMPSLQVVVHINTLKLFYAESAQLQNVRNHLNESFGHQYPSEFTPEDIHYYVDSPDELAVINYTSGTSGFSKGVMIPYRSLWSNMEFGFQKFPELKAGDNVVSMLPLAHMLGLMFDFLMEMALGMHVHFLTRMPSPKIIVEAMETIKPRIIVAVPLIVEKIYRAKLRPIIDRNRFFFRIPLLDQYLRKRIKDELTATFGGNFLELVVGGANVFLGYYKNPEATAQTFTADGWLRTGDMGVMDQDGFLYLKGRTKCMILGPSGQNIYPEELEGVLNNLDYVVDSLVIEDQDGLTALIYPDFPKAAQNGMGSEEVQAYLTARIPVVNRELPNYAHIKKFEYLPEDFERTPKRSIKRYIYQRK